MVGHNDECVGLHARVKCWQIVPYIVHHFSCIVQLHLIMHHLTKQKRPILRANGDKIRPRLAIIVAF
jgi:hypothetical protein